MKKFYVGKRMVGELENGVFRKEVTYSLHRMRVINSWGIDAKTFHKLPEKCEIRIHDIENDIIYKTTKEEYLENQVYYHFKEEGKDHRAQIFLPLEKFEREKPPELTEEQRAEAEYKRNFL